jgi:hypothetical protein
MATNSTGKSRLGSLVNRRLLAVAPLILMVSVGFAGLAQAREVESLDDRGGLRHDHPVLIQRVEPGDDRGGLVGGAILVDGNGTPRVADDRGGDTPRDARTEPGDDRAVNGSAAVTRRAEPGDDRGGVRVGRSVEPGDDRGGTRVGREPEPGDDHGGRRGGRGGDD